MAGAGGAGMAVGALPFVLALWVEALVAVGAAAVAAGAVAEGAMAKGDGAGCGATAGVGAGVVRIGLGVDLLTVLGCGVAFGAGGGEAGAIISIKISAGTTTSATRRSKPLCMAQSTAMCMPITLLTMTALRLIVGNATERRCTRVDMGIAKTLVQQETGAIRCPPTCGACCDKRR